jgi:hypothetical protein
MTVVLDNIKVLLKIIPSKVKTMSKQSLLGKI